MRPPDKTGPAARAWLRALPAVQAVPDWEATLRFWYVDAPHAHPFWHWYVVSCISLRPLPGVRPAALQYPEATHEMMILALNPDSDPPPGPDVEKLDHLVSIDFVGQFHGVTDDQAAAICDEAIDRICDGTLSPDQDFRQYWKMWLQAVVERKMRG